MKSRPLAEVKAKLSEYVSATREEAVLITKNGKPAALLVHVDEDADLEDVVLAASPKFWAILRRSEEQIRRGEVLEHEEFWHQVEERYGKEAATAEGVAPEKKGKGRRKG
jgi:prevent-host-death family protein